MYALTLLLGCTDALVPELVLGADVATTWTYGSAQSELGKSVAVHGSVWATAPGAGELWTDGVGAEGPSFLVGATDEGLVAIGDGGTVWRDGTVVTTVPDAVRWAIGPAGIAWASKTEVGLVDGATWAVDGATALGVGAARVAVATCTSRCTVTLHDLDGTQQGAVDDLDDIGAVAEWDGLFWIGEPDDAVDDGAGRVCSELGDCVEGEVGDHLGRAIGGGFTAGQFNRWIVPPRARIVPLVGGDAYAEEVGTEIQPISLAGDGSTLVVGAPYYPYAGTPAGSVAVVALP